MTLFNERIHEIKQYSEEEVFNQLKQVPLRSLPVDIDDAKEELFKQIVNDGNCFNEEKFISLLRQVSGSQEGGWDNLIRLPQFTDEA